MQPSTLRITSIQSAKILSLKMVYLKMDGREREKLQYPRDVPQVPKHCKPAARRGEGLKRYRVPMAIGNIAVVVEAPTPSILSWTGGTPKISYWSKRL